MATTWYDYSTIEWKNDIDSTNTYTLKIQTTINYGTSIEPTIFKQGLILNHRPTNNFYDCDLIGASINTTISHADFDTNNELLTVFSLSNNTSRAVLTSTDGHNMVFMPNWTQTTVDYSFPDATYSLTFDDGLERASGLQYQDLGSFTNTDGRIKISDFFANCIYLMGFGYDFTIRDFVGISGTNPVTYQSFTDNFYLTDSELKTSGTYRDVGTLLKEVCNALNCRFFQEYSGEWTIFSNALEYFRNESKNIPYYDIDYTEAYGRTVGGKSGWTGKNTVTSLGRNLESYQLQAAPNIRTIRINDGTTQIASRAGLSGFSSYWQNYDYTVTTPFTNLSTGSTGIVDSAGNPIPANYSYYVFLTGVTDSNQQDYTGSAGMAAFTGEFKWQVSSGAIEQPYFTTTVMRNNLASFYAMRQPWQYNVLDYDIEMVLGQSHDLKTNVCTRYGLGGVT